MHRTEALAEQEALEQQEAAETQPLWQRCDPNAGRNPDT